MAAKKISQLPAATSPVAPTSELPINQGGDTKRAAISQLGFAQAGAGAQTRTIQDKLRDMVSVFDFMTAAQIADVQSGALTQNVRTALQAAFNSGAKTFYFPSGSYWLGSAATAINFLDLSALGSNITFITGKSVRFVCQTTANVMPNFFYMVGNSNFNCGPVQFQDLGYDSSVTWKGAHGFYMDCSTSASWGDVVFDSIYAKNLVSPVTITGGNSSNRIRGVRVGQLFSDDCYYGFNAQNNGDGVAIDNLIAFQNYRPYFVYGVSDHKVKIFNRNNRSTSAAVNIARAVGGLNTSGLDITYVARDMSVGITHVLIDHIDLLGGEISNIKVRLDIRSSVIYTPLRFVNYTGSGGSETNAASSNQVYDIDIAGSCDVQANAVSAVAAYASKRRLTFTQGQLFTFDNTITALFALDQNARSQPVTWTAGVTNPTLGNGTLVSSYDVVGGLCTYNVTLTAGSTTNFGSGDWLFSAPFFSYSDAVGSVWVLDSGTQYYIGVCRITNGTASVACFTNAASGFRSTVPMTWANGDQLMFTITYPIS
jgi:hypothetical protein